MHPIWNLKKIGKPAFLWIIMILLTPAFALGSAQAKAFDFSDWDAILKERVSTTNIRGIQLNVVDYKGLKSAPEFKKLLLRLENADAFSLKGSKEKLAFWINVYNIFAVKMALDHYPVESIKDVGSIFKSVWNRRAGKVAGEDRTLNDIEHKILRKMGEPRIHVAIVCASVSCPDLARSAFVPEKLDEQLDEQMEKFLANAAKGLKIDRKSKRVHISPIFKWFAEDFDSKGGPVPFIGGYLSTSDRKFINHPDTGISFFDYDWGLNES